MDRVSGGCRSGERDVELTAYTLGELRAHLAARPLAVNSPLFPTRPGGRLNASNVRNRLLNGSPARNGRQPIHGVVQRVNEKRAAEGRMLLPERVTPHALRRTWAMLALTAGRDARWVMAQMGHADARLTLQVYAQVIQRQDADHELVWRLMRFSRTSSRGGPERVITRRLTQWLAQWLPTTSATTLRGSSREGRNRLHLQVWSQPGSNRRPPACKAGALPAELWPLVKQSSHAQAALSNSSATRSVASPIPPSSRRASWARRKNSGASCSHVAPMPPWTEIIVRLA